MEIKINRLYLLIGFFLSLIMVNTIYKSINKSCINIGILYTVLIVSNILYIIGYKYDYNYILLIQSILFLLVYIKLYNTMLQYKDNRVFYMQCNLDKNYIYYCILIIVTIISFILINYTFNKWKKMYPKT